MVDSIEKVNGLLKTKKKSSLSASSFEKVKTKDQLSLSATAKESVEKKRFVDLLLKMPEARPSTLEKEYNYSSPQVFKEVARRLLEEGF